MKTTINEVWVQMCNYTIVTGDKPTHILMHPDDFTSINKGLGMSHWEYENSGEMFGLKVVRSKDITKGAIKIVKDEQNVLN